MPEWRAEAAAAGGGERAAAVGDWELSPKARRNMRDRKGGKIAIAVGFRDLGKRNE